jgi:hypothetical protein
MRWAGHVALTGESAYMVLVERPEERRPLGRPRHKWENNVKIDLQGVEWGEWIGWMWHRIGTDGGL